MFFIGALPALLVFFIRSKVDESPAWKAGHASAVKPSFRWSSISSNAGLFLFLVLLMFAFTSFSHGSQDLFPTLLQKGKHFSPARVGLISVISGIGALLGGISFGTWSEKLGRRRAIIIAALLAIPMIPLWVYTNQLVFVALGGFLMQFMVQGAWGIIPAHLNELSPGAVRATFAGLAYQLGALLSSYNGPYQTILARKYFGGSLQPVMAGTVVVIGLLVALLTYLGTEAKGKRMDAI